MEQKKITFNRDLNKAMKFASQKALVENSDFITPEHLLYGMMTLPQMQDLMWSCNEAFDLDDFLDELDEHIEESTKDDSQGAKPNDICEPSFQLQQVFTDAVRQAIMAERKAIDMPMAINAILCLENSWAAYLLRKHANVEDFEIMTATEIHFHERSTGVEEDDDQYSNGEGDNPFGLFDDDDEDLLFGDEDDFSSPSHKNDKWKKYVTCINEHLAEKNPLIGRERELDRTIQVLCRKDKNNPLHIGEPGVGKTALVYGVARRIEEGKVPDRLKGCNIYQLDMGTLLAGTRFRGDMEQRLKQIMEGVTSEAHCIIYLDEIHNIVGAGKGAEGGSDVSDLLKPYLDDDRIRVIGATTYTEYNKNFTRSVGMIRRFQTIDVEEPSIDEAIHILKSLKPIYEKYHHVKYDAAAIEYAVTSSAKFITDRFLPDKAIDIIDEAGAQAEMEGKKYKKIGKKQIAEVLAKVAKIDALAIKQDDNKNLASLESRMKDVIYGQDRAIQTVVEAVQLSKAGLTDENKPLASLLFVGPTGVGKTEVAKMLAQELGVKLVRFDMSEYVEKHTVAKLIGAPAGYVGYDDGGLLTDAVR
ncbi:MAG: AAA family ATPase, partial [Bacteroidales bacterium]|nr:AAA family ATPase [Bacteroidales bacterium]